MKQYTLADLTVGGEGPVLRGILPGHLAERGGITRYEYGTRSHPEGYHTHEFPEVFVIFQGSGFIEIDGARTEFAAGDVFLVEAGEDHHVNSAGTVPLLSAWLHLHEA
ncbi:MAG: cupin domain-containing protein [Catenulispora sp.]|nr:cupin domain-containing protein [Catenulispora sp.]